MPDSLRTIVPVLISIEPGLLPVILGTGEGSLPGWAQGKLNVETWIGGH